MCLPGSKTAEGGSDRGTAEYEDLIQEIVTRAEGVFLWVHLVSRTLRIGVLEHGDSIDMLRRKLKHLPSELGEFFRHMLDSIDPIYQKEAYRTLAVTLRLVDSERGGWPLFFLWLALPVSKKPRVCSASPMQDSPAIRA
ncbi:hypothetical protein B0H67DRAFT_301250 [Lasiosphaeris hirsuta]|uniref:Uncharacterized protein n=1 Tax=Lasiosphaeris hirsuta TaxID=260670 RepID=A0AA40A9Q7_9PEZI|nr:hypothetical protein B0H67DRAFT_301250 [Lasiosphaeris hirsuta]